MFRRPARWTAPRLPSGEGNAMTAGPRSSRTEVRTPMKVLVELCSFENITHEFAYTVDVSAHGARVLTKNPWQSNQHLTVRSVQGNLCIRRLALLTANLLTVVALPSAWNCVNQQRIGRNPKSIQFSFLLSAHSPQSRPLGQEPPQTAPRRSVT